MDQNVPMKVHEAIFNQILDKPENKVCADCPNKSPTWASIDFGVFICLRCSGAHRRLSPVVTRVRSAKIDDWKMDHIEIMAAVGNKLANDYWECNAPSYYKKPDISTSLDDVFEMVKTKYVKAAYAAKDRLSPVKEFLEAKKDGETTAGSFHQAKMAQITKTPQVTVNTTTTTKPTEKKTSLKTHNLIDFDDDGDFGDFKSAPEKTTKLDIPKPSVEVKFVSNNGQPQKSTSDLWDLNFDTRTPSTNLQKTTSADPFSFEQPNTQKTNSTPSDSNKLYDLYKTGNQTTQNTTKPGNGPNFSGGQSNYAYLDMMGGGGNQQRFNQPQQSFGFQGGMNSNNQFYGGAQNKPTGFNSQPGMNGSFGSSGYGANNGFNSFGSGGYSSGPVKPTFGTQPQQPQPFTFGQPTTTTTTSTFSFNTVTPTQNFSQPTTVNAGFSFL